MDAAATLLDMSQDDLRTALKGGSTLGDIAKAKGVSTDDVTKAIVTALKVNMPADAPALTDEQLTAMAGNIVAGKRPGPRPAENPLAAEFVRQAAERSEPSGAYGRTPPRSGGLVDFSV